VSTDPCSCEVLCPHGDRCLGSHAHFPSSHWWHCDTCTPPDGVAYRLVSPEGEVLLVVSGCRHALGPGRLAEVHREMAGHVRTCPDRSGR
jgi:hypothetical protein